MEPMSVCVPKPICWQESRSIIQTGDLLQCRPTSLEGRRIVSATRQPLRDSGRPAWQNYSHSAMAGWTFGPSSIYPRLMHGETVGHRDAHVIDMEQEVARFPGYYDLWRIPMAAWGREHGPLLAWDAMLAAAGAGYGYRIIWWQWCYRRLPLARYWLRRVKNSESPTSQRVCSGLVHWAIRRGRGPQVSRYDCEVSPNDLPQIAEYVGTIFYTKQQVGNFLFHMERVS